MLRAKIKEIYYRITGKDRPTFTNSARSMRRYSVGQWTYGVPTVFDWGDDTSLTIGKFCSIAGDVKIFLGGNHRVDWVTTYPLAEIFRDCGLERAMFRRSRGDVRIGNDVWIGYGAIILSGVKIGNGAVIGAACLVTKDVPPYAMVGGNPAKVIGMRFSDTQIKRLEALAWWDWPLEDIRKSARELASSDIDAICARVPFDKVSGE